MSPQAGYVLRDEIAPRIAGVVPRSIQPVGAEDHQELIADGICMAAQMIERVESQGKLGKITASNIAYYCLQHMKSGRRARGSNTVDAHGTQTQLNGHTELHLMSEVVSQSETGDDIHELSDVISQDTEDPSTIAARNMDWAVLMSKLTTIERLLVECLTDGLTAREICRRVKMTKAKLALLQHEVAVKIRDVMGAEVLRDIIQVPQWRIGMDCERAMLACRADRRN